MTISVYNIILSCQTNTLGPEVSEEDKEGQELYICTALKNKV